MCFVVLFLIFAEQDYITDGFSKIGNKGRDNHRQALCTILAIVALKVSNFTGMILLRMNSRSSFLPRSNPLANLIRGTNPVSLASCGQFIEVFGRAKPFSFILMP